MHKSVINKIERLQITDFISFYLCSTLLLLVINCNKLATKSELNP